MNRNSKAKIEKTIDAIGQIMAGHTAWQQIAEVCFDYMGRADICTSLPLSYSDWRSLAIAALVSISREELFRDAITILAFCQTPSTYEEIRKATGIGDEKVHFLIISMIRRGIPVTKMLDSPDKEDARRTRTLIEFIPPESESLDRWVLLSQPSLFVEGREAPTCAVDTLIELH